MREDRLGLAREHELGSSGRRDLGVVEGHDAEGVARQQEFV
jgi:hypothetical protein